MDSYWQEELEHCPYTIRLLDKVQAEHRSVDMYLIKKAIYYAKTYHGTQMRDSGEPFYSHPLEVAYMLADYLLRTDLLITAILHDTIEDTPLTKEMIATAFGENIANKVADLTRIKETGKISSQAMVESLYIQKKLDILLIKLSYCNFSNKS
jgi:(p)ppGpp synthase/HD superfamily hydrolase